MSNEHIQHRQCQTCFIYFPTNQELIQHIEEYRSEERLLVAKLERYRLHLTESHDSDNGDDDDRDGEDYDHEPTVRLSQLQCPFRGCKRVELFTTRSNLVRHFQTHIQCCDVCPFCEEIFRYVHQFLRHECEHGSDNPKDTYMQRRVAQLNRTVSRELDRLQSLPNYTRKRAYRVVDSDSTRAQKKVKTTQIPVLPANTPLQPYLSIACSVATDDELTSPETTRVTATSNLDETFAKAATMGLSSNNQLIFPSETAISISANDSGWAFTETAAAMPANDGGWAFTETAPSMPAQDSGWALAETVPAISANDGGWAFAEPAPAMPANDGGWAFAKTVR